MSISNRYSFLKEIFHEDLSSEENSRISNGRIHVREMHWSPEELLEGLSDANSDLYANVFSNWILDRKRNLLDNSVKILAKYDNQDRFVSLKKIFERNLVTPFVGSGMSMPSGYPGWTNFLKQLCCESHVEGEQLNKMLDDGLYEEAAQKIFDDIGSQLFNEYLNNAFCNLKQPVGPINYLPLMFDTSVISTNFDKLLEGIYKEAGRSFDEVILGTSAHHYPKQVASGERILLKLHGYGDRETNRVLTMDEYNCAYGEGKLINDLVSEVFFHRSMLFLGCSLTIDRTIQLMEKHVITKKGIELPCHYAFLKLNENDDRIARKKQLAKANIFPIWYEDIDHDEAMETLLLALAEGVVDL